MYEIDTKTGGNDMATLYRGVDTILENTDRNESPVSVLYRGVNTLLLRISLLSQVKEFTVALSGLLNS